MQFASVGDFVFALDARTSVLPLRLFELQSRSAEDLQQELETVGALERRLAGVVDDHDRHARSCIDALKALGSHAISKDHEWRFIIQQICLGEGDRETFLRAALECYLRYLGGRRAVVRAILDARQPVAGAAFEPEKATVMFDVAVLPEPSAHEPLQRLPQGEAVTLRLADGTSVSVTLARHHFSLIHNRDWSLVADNGKRYVLRHGLNSVGRGRGNDVPLDPDYRNVSRTHLLAQPLDSDAIVLTDVSSYGTFVPRAAIAS